ncbi:hypothetical protein B0H16DRAFT_1895179 [Mycena metata]|uniref:MYND-type domain-containing protein n=1 Tax=Mycena metata TaxID=1033252 RepID=A0AAD7HP66_9AGAR|nr:hypothetical protein B0H16DRAFT_1895179 [Mycena metata]
MITSASNNRDSDISSYLQAALEPFRLYTCFYSVLSCLEPALHDVEDLQATPAFVQSDLFEAWSAFCDLAQSRISILKRYKSASYISLKPCGSLKCAEIHRKRVLMRCSGCKRQYYCSRRCQSVDWEDGHRTACPRLVSANRDEPEHLTTRDKSFLRALIDHDYKLSQLDILRYELDFIHAYPDRMPCLVFDYS